MKRLALLWLIVGVSITGCSPQMLDELAGYDSGRGGDRSYTIKPESVATTRFAGRSKSSANKDAKKQSFGRSSWGEYQGFADKVAREMGLSNTPSVQLGSCDGMAGQAQVGGNSICLNLSGVKSKAYTRYTIAHEFGHVAGYRNEHDADRLALKALKSIGDVEAIRSNANASGKGFGLRDENEYESGVRDFQQALAEMEGGRDRMSRDGRDYSRNVYQRNQQQTKSWTRRFMGAGRAESRQLSSEEEWAKDYQRIRQQQNGR